jgi:Copper resistance protein K
VYVFKDGKMGMEDRLGRVVGMKPGHVMETKDGQRIIMIGNELARLDAIKAAERSGN